MKLRARRGLRRPHKFIALYGYENGIPGYAMSCFKVQKRKKRQRIEELEEREIEPEEHEIPSEEFETETIVHTEASTELNSIPEPETALTLQPYLERGKEKIVHLYALYAQDGEERIMYVRGDSLEISCKSGITHIGRLHDIQLHVSCGTQLRMTLRPYYRCVDLDPYVTEATVGRELCLQSPCSLIHINATDARSIKKIQVVENEEEHTEETVLMRRAYVKHNESWNNIKECLLQETIQDQQKRRSIVIEDDIEDSSDEDLTTTMPPNICLLKHAFESDFGLRGFVDFLCMENDSTADREAFIDYIQSKYIDPAEEVGCISNTTGQRLFSQLSDRGGYVIQNQQVPKTETCCLCKQVTLCSYVIILSDNTHKPVSKGCAKRLRRVDALKSFLAEHDNAHKEITKQEVIEIHTILVKILYAIDRCLKRPIREILM